VNRRYFTLSEVNRMIPQLESRFRRMLQLHVQIRDIHARLTDLGYAPREEDFSLVPEGAPFEVTQHLAELRALIDALNADLETLHAEGCVVKDIGSGLVDWYAKKDGRDVFLCWKLGEKSVDWWHELETGFSGRRPVSEL
jgi:hypothetical protein